MEDKRIKITQYSELQKINNKDKNNFIIDFPSIYPELFEDSFKEDICDIELNDKLTIITSKSFISERSTYFKSFLSDRFEKSEIKIHDFTYVIIVLFNIIHVLEWQHITKNYLKMKYNIVETKKIISYLEDDNDIMTIDGNFNFPESFLNLGYEQFSTFTKLVSYFGFEIINDFIIPSVKKFIGDEDCCFTKITCKIPKIVDSITTLMLCELKALLIMFGENGEYDFIFESLNLKSRINSFNIKYIIEICVYNIPNIIHLIKMYDRLREIYYMEPCTNKIKVRSPSSNGPTYDMMDVWSREDWLYYTETDKKKVTVINADCVKWNRPIFTAGEQILENRETFFNKIKKGLGRAMCDILNPIEEHIFVFYGMMSYLHKHVEPMKIQCVLVVINDVNKLADIIIRFKKNDKGCKILGKYTDRIYDKSIVIVPSNATIPTLIIFNNKNKLPPGYINEGKYIASVSNIINWCTSTIVMDIDILKSLADTPELYQYISYIGCSNFVYSPQWQKKIFLKSSDLKYGWNGKVFDMKKCFELFSNTDDNKEHKFTQQFRFKNVLWRKEIIDSFALSDGIEIRLPIHKSDDSNSLMSENKCQLIDFLKKEYTKFIKYLEHDKISKNDINDPVQKKRRIEQKNVYELTDSDDEFVTTTDDDKIDNYILEEVTLDKNGDEYIYEIKLDNIKSFTSFIIDELNKKKKITFPLEEIKLPYVIEPQAPNKAILTISNKSFHEFYMILKFPTVLNLPISVTLKKKKLEITIMPAVSC
jgi:hypothetical protein